MYRSTSPAMNWTREYYIEWIIPSICDPRCSQLFSCGGLCVFSFYNGVSDVNMDVIKKLLADNKQVKSMRLSCEEFCISAAPKLCYTHPHRRPAGEHHRLVQATQEHGTADDLQRKARPREAEERAVQPSPDLPAADAQQRVTDRLNPQDGVRCLHLTQQVGISFLIVCLFIWRWNAIGLSRVTMSEPTFNCICTLCVFSCSSCRRFTNVPVLVNNLGLLEQLSYWKVSASCSAAGYNLTMKKHGSDPAHGRDFRILFGTKSLNASSFVPGLNSSAPTGS